MKRITIIGAGAMGQTLAALLRRKKNLRIDLWDIVKDRVPGQQSLERIVPDADLLLFCVPSWALRSALTGVVQHIGSKMVVATLAKGIEAGTRATMDQVLHSLLPKKQPHAMLCGPMLANELGTFGVGMVGTTSHQAKSVLKQAFAGTPLRLEFTQDVRGVSLAAVFKNVYAFGLGVADALKLGDNFKGWYIVRASEEMAAGLRALGGKAETAYGTGGLGDLVATGFSPFSNNRSMGAELVQAGVCSLKSEGCASLASLASLLGKRISAMPIVKAIQKMVTDGKSSREDFSKIMKNL